MLRPRGAVGFATRRVLLSFRNGLHMSSKSYKNLTRESLMVFPGAAKSQFITKLDIIDPINEPVIPTYRLVDSDGIQVDKTSSIDLSKDDALTMYKNMNILKIMDVIMYEAQRQGRISFYMVSQGEEGITVGSGSVLSPDDVIFSQYREAGVLLQKGFTLEEFMDQLFGNEGDYGGGRSMPVHYMSSKLNFHPISSPLTTQLPHAVGAAYLLKLQGKKSAVFCYLGDGAASEGDFHAALNIAATKSCPVVFICRNNGFAISTPTSEQYRGDGIASRGIGYGIKTMRVDGNDIFAVRKATQVARDIAINEQRPVLIEAMSYRVSHHSTSDDSFAYRQKTEAEDWKRKQDPISRMNKWLKNQNYWSDDDDLEFKKFARKQILIAFSKAEKKKKPPLNNLFKDTFDKLPPSLEEQKLQLVDILKRYPEQYDLSAYQDGIDSLESK